MPSLLCCFLQIDGELTLVIARGEAVGGNPAHMAPEVLNALKALLQPRTASVIVDYTKQAVFETGVLLCELAVLKHAIPEYPTSVTVLPSNKIEYDDASICPWLNTGECVDCVHCDVIVWVA
jgi:hypothetical protein